MKKGCKMKQKAFLMFKQIKANKIIFFGRWESNFQAVLGDLESKILTNQFLKVKLNRLFRCSIYHSITSGVIMNYSFLLISLELRLLNNLQLFKVCIEVIISLSLIAVLPMLALITYACFMNCWWLLYINYWAFFWIYWASFFWHSVCSLFFPLNASWSIQGCHQ